MLNGHGCWKRLPVESPCIAVVLVAVLSVTAACAVVSISWKAVSNAGQAIALFRNSHSTAEYSTDRVYETISGNYLACHMP